VANHFPVSSREVEARRTIALLLFDICQLTRQTEAGEIMVEIAGQESMGPGTRSRTLRLALAMRGGVSLAVWIGGAVAEIDLFRRACHRAAQNLLPPNENDRRHERAVKYRELLATTKYDSVEVDILAGASAGGLNAVLFGLAQVCGTVMDEPVRSTWIDCGGIWDLLREPGFGRVPSILKGDGRLFTVVRDALTMIADPSSAPEHRTPLKHQGTEADRVDVELAATLLDDPYNEERGNRASFSFTKTPGDLESHFTTIPTPGEASTPIGRVALNRMALAARSTSSFPGAFEPAGIYSSPGHSEDFNRGHIRHPSPRSREGTDDGLYVNMARAFLYARPNDKSGSEPFNVVDGGIFDNIPIDRAIRAIRRAPTSQPSERWLIYLDPEPPTSRDPVSDSKHTSSAASWVPVIRSSMALKKRTETASDELRQLHEHNQASLAARGRLDALGALLTDLGDSAKAMESVDDILSEQSYRQCRIATDTARISTLLAEPWSELCQPPREAVDYAGLAPEKALLLKDAVAEAYNDSKWNWQLPQDIYAKLDWVRILIAWVQALERILEGLAQDSPASPAGQGDLSLQLRTYKDRIYRCLTVLVEAKRLTTDLALAEPLRENPMAARNYDMSKLPARLALGRTLQRSLTMPTELAQLVTCDDANDAKNATFYARLAKWSESRHETHRCLIALFDAGHLTTKLVLQDPFEVDDGTESNDAFLRRLTCDPVLAQKLREAVANDEEYRKCLANLAGTADKEATEECFAATLDGELNRVRKQILQDSSPVVEEVDKAHGSKKWSQRWQESVFSHFYRAPLESFSLEKLSRLFATVGIPDSGSVIFFDQITGDERPEFDVRKLENGARAKQLSTWLCHPPKDEPMRRVLSQPRRDMLTADAKLAGNVVSRFGGFFRARWRENDWQWGRLDAAAGIVRILNRGRPQPLLPDSDKLRQHVAELQASIVFESWESVEVPHKLVGHAGSSIVETVGAEDLDALSPHYRFALASRIVPLVYRALMPSRAERWSIVGIATRIGQVVIRPLAVPLTLIADPLRLVLALAVILLAASFLGAARSDPGWQIVFAAMYFAAGVLIAIRAWVAHTRWKNLAKQLSAVAGRLDVWEWRSILEKANRTKRWYIAGSFLLALITCGWSAHHLYYVTVDLLAAAQPHIAMPLESMLAATILIVGLQHWLNKRAYQIKAQPTTFRTVLDDFRRHWVRRVLAVLAVIVGLCVLRISNVIATYQSAVFDGGGFPHWWSSSLPGASIGLGRLSAKEFWIDQQTWWWDRSPVIWAVAGTAVALLILISLWGWVDNKWAITCTVVGAGLAGLAQWGLDDHIARAWRLWDVLPMLVWMGFLGAVVAWLPVRRAKSGKPANFGETDVPVLK
jgi:patatin-related protein